MEIGFTGKTAIVTGAAHGLGRAITHGLVTRGARVWALDVLENDLKETEDMARSLGDSCITTRVVDITDREAVGSTVKEAIEYMGKVDILVHSAGGVCGQVGQFIEDVTEDQWQDIYEVNLKGAFLCAQSVVPSMKSTGGGRILIISSGAGFGVSLTGIQSYVSSKAGQIGLVRQLAHELGQFGITVNSVAPGLVRSNPSTEKQWAAMGTQGQKRLVDSIFVRRLGKPEDIANAAMFLLSDHASYITGQTLSVNGGR